MCSQSRHCTIHCLEEPKTIGTGFVVYPIGINLFDGSEGCSIFNYLLLSFCMNSSQQNR